jgi:hypothetical protein
MTEIQILIIMSLPIFYILFAWSCYSLGKSSMKKYASKQCQKRDELIKAQEELLEVRRQKCEILIDNKNSDVIKMIGLVKLDDELKDKITNIKK